MWTTIATIQVTQDFQLTPAIAPNLGYVRLTFATAGIPIFISQVNLDNNNYFDHRRIAATAYSQIFEFECPSVFLNRAIALRLAMPATPFDVQIEVSDTPSSSSGNGGTIDIQPVLNGQSQILQMLQALDVDLDPQIAANIQSIVNSQDSQSNNLIQILQNLGLQTQSGIGTTQARPPVLQQILDRQAQLLQAISSVGLDPDLAANVESIVNSQDSQSDQLTQILQRQNQPVAVDPAIIAALTTLLNGQSNQTASLAQIQSRQSDHSLSLGQIQASQNQILQAIGNSTAPQFDLITTAYTASQSTPFGSTTIGTFANLNDNNGTTGTGTNTNATEWIKATFPSAVTVRAVRVGGGNLANWGGVASFLNGRILQYSTDDQNWLTLLTIANVQDSGPNQFVLHALGQPITARFWRILASSNYLSTTEFRFFS